MAALAKKLSVLDDILAKSDGALVAYSGGVDSGFVLHRASEILGSKVKAVTGVSPSIPAGEVAAAESFAKQHRISWIGLATGELDREDYSSNPENRCYYCKDELFTGMRKLADDAGFPSLMDGTNGDDGLYHRPGLEAASSWGVISPLAMAGLSKLDVRKAAAEAGLSIWNKPASPCLASRIPPGQPITEEKLRRIEQAEAAVAGLGFNVFRVRHVGAGARLEMAAEEMAGAESRRQELLSSIAAAGFQEVSSEIAVFVSGSLQREYGSG